MSCKVQFLHKKPTSDNIPVTKTDKYRDIMIDVVLKNPNVANRNGASASNLDSST